MSAKHTPGPWKVEQDAEGPHMLVVDEQDVTVCRVYQQPYDTWLAADTAAAIAALPEMLESLYWMVLLAEEAIAARKASEDPEDHETLDLYEANLAAANALLAKLRP